MLYFLLTHFLVSCLFQSFEQAYFILSWNVTFHPGSNFCFQFPQYVSLLLNTVKLSVQHIKYFLNYASKERSI